MLERLIEILREAGSDPDDRTIADMLWLIEYYHSPSLPTKQASLSTPPSQTLEQPPTPDQPNATKSAGGHDTSSREEVVEDHTHALYPQGNNGEDRYMSGRPIKVPGASPLPDALNIARSLRPLRKRLRMVQTSVLDEQKTVQRTAEAQALMPVFRNTASRWLSLDLVIDQARSMAIWHQTILEFRALLMRQGTFRQIRTWSLFTDQTVPVLCSGIGRGHAHGSPRHPDELRDPTGKRVILVFSDCVTLAWRQGHVQDLCVRWGETNPLAIVHVLPAHLWSRSVIGAAQEVRIQPRQVGGANTYLQVDMTSEEDFEQDQQEQPPGIAVPVVTLDAQALKSWAQVLAGKRDAVTPGVFFQRGQVWVLPQTSSHILTAEQRIQRFFNTSTTLAQELVGHLAFVPITMPIIRLLQVAMLPESRLSHVAEIFLSGLVRVEAGHDDPDAILYNFHEGVRDILQKSVARSRATQIIGLLDNDNDVIEAISRYLANQTGFTREFMAIVRDVSALAQAVHIPDLHFTRIKLAWLGLTIEAHDHDPQQNHSQAPGVQFASDLRTQIKRDNPAQSTVLSSEISSILSARPREFGLGRPYLHDHANAYDPSLYVPRDSLEETLRRAMLAPVSQNPPSPRSFILQGPTLSGKTWLMQNLQQSFQDESNIIVLLVNRETFSAEYTNKPEELFLPLVEILKVALKVKINQIDTTTITGFDDINEIPSNLDQLGRLILQVTLPPLILIIVDGMDAIIELSRQRQIDDPRLAERGLLSRFEDEFILPLFRFNNVRLLGTRRSGISASWRLHPVRQASAATSYEITSLASVQAQYDRLALAFNRSTLPLLNQIQSSFSYYTWNNVGINAMLIRHAFEYGLPLTEAVLVQCINELLRSPVGDPLPALQRQQLETVISAHYISSTTLAEQLLPVVAINDYLQINDTSRRDFVNVMAKYGIAMIKGPYFIIMSEIIELFQDLQRANTLQPAATTPPTSTFNQTGQQVGIPSNAAHDINIHVSAPPKRDGAPREQADVVIITALDEELDAVLHHLPRAHRRTFPNDVHVYYHTTVSSSTGERSRRYQVVVLALVDMGRISASDATQEALRRWAPHCVLMVGIAGGIAESGVAIGDVLLADQIVDYEVQKLTEIGPEVRYRVFPVPPKWRAMAQSLHESEWLPLIRVSRPEAGRPKHHTGPVASGDKVQGIAAMVSRYQEFWPKLIGIEMESAGVASVALNITPTPAFFMIRGVSDLANAAKNSAAVEQWRPYACAVAAAYAVALLTSGLIPTRAEVVGDS